MAPFHAVVRTTKATTKNCVDFVLSRYVVDKFGPLPNYSYGHPNVSSEYRDVQKFAIPYKDTPRLNPLIARAAVAFMVSVYAGLLINKCDYLDPGPKFDDIPVEQALLYLRGRSSPGYPYNERFATKKQVIDSFQKGTFALDQHLRRRIDGHMCFFSVNGKHETRATSKIGEDELRDFVVGPICNNIICVMATNRFYSAMTSVDGPFAIGTSFLHGGTQDYIDAIPGDCYSSDRIKWDGSVQPEVHEYCDDFEREFLSPQGQFLNDVVGCNEHHHYLIMSDGQICTVYGGEPSGGPKTTMRNSEANWFMFLYFTMYNHTLRIERMPTHRELSENLYYTCYGDDSVHWTSPSWAVHGSPSSLNSAMRAHRYCSFYDNYDDTLTAPSDTVYLSQIPVLVRGHHVARLISTEKALVTMVTGANRRVPDGLNWTWYEYQLSRVYQYSTILWPDQDSWWKLQSVIASYEEYVREHQQTPNLGRIKASQHLSWDDCFSLHVHKKEYQSRLAFELIQPGMSKNMKETIAVALTPNNRGLRNKLAIHRKRSQSVPKKTTTAKRKEKKSDKVITHFAIPAAKSAVVKNRNRKTKIARTEVLTTYIENVSSSSSEGAFSYALDGPINPGNNLFFPRTVAMAQIYEKWRPVFLEAIFIPCLGYQTPGNAAMYFDYDPVDGADTSMGQILENANSAILPVWKESKITLSDRNRSNWYYCQIQNTNTGTAIDRQQTPADFRFATRGCSANLTVGSVLLTYQFEFMDAKPSATNSVSNGSTNAVALVPGIEDTVVPQQPNNFCGQGTNLQDMAFWNSSQRTTVTARNCCFTLTPGEYRVYATMGFSGNSNPLAVRLDLRVRNYGGTNDGVSVYGVSNTNPSGNMTLTGSFTVTNDSATAQRNVFYFALSCSVGSPAPVANNLAYSIVSLGPQNVGAASTSRPGRTFQLPRQLHEVFEHFSRLDGEWALIDTTTPAAPVTLETKVAELEEMLDRMAQRLPKSQVTITRKCADHGVNEDEKGLTLANVPGTYAPCDARCSAPLKPKTETLPNGASITRFERCHEACPIVGLKLSIPAPDIEDCAGATGDHPTEGSSRSSSPTSSISIL